MNKAIDILSCVTWLIVLIFLFGTGYVDKGLEILAVVCILIQTFRLICKE